MNWDQGIADIGSSESVKVKPNRTLVLAIFSSWLAFDYGLSFLGPLAIFVSWIILPGLYVMFGFRKLLLYEVLTLIESLPRSLAPSSGTAQIETQVLTSKKPIPTPSFLIPVANNLSAVRVDVAGFFSPLTVPLGAFYASLPLPIRLMISLTALGVCFYVLIRLNWHLWTREARKLLGTIPQLIGWGIIPYVEPMVFETTDEPYRDARWIRRKMLGKVWN